MIARRQVRILVTFKYGIISSHIHTHHDLQLPCQLRTCVKCLFFRREVGFVSGDMSAFGTAAPGIGHGKSRLMQGLYLEMGYSLHYASGE